MKYCGIELKSSEARIVSIQVDESGDYNIIASKTKKIKLTDPKSQEGAQLFRDEFNTFFQENGFQKLKVALSLV